MTRARRRRKPAPPAGPLVLGVDTSTLVMSVALTAGDRLLAESTFDLPRGHSRALLGAADHLFGRCGVGAADLDGIAVGRGPGSFTGLRIGMALAKGLALAFEKPIWGISSLHALARAWQRGPDDLVLACIDARKGEIYVGGWQGENNVFEERVVAPDRLAEALLLELPGRSLTLVGSGATAYRDALAARLGEGVRFASGDASHPPARHVAWLASRGKPAELDALEPRYIRPSEAELTLPNTPEFRTVSRGLLLSFCASQTRHSSH